ncbi:hypothetical protein B0A48_16722 [Cryoendolithus antarcticus]|uniref:Heterokaryon incompatibility domain-containing protein n=1 Tax=Cryoendolithus antarcticus TaxID=1507870 RepID=A0A1V8SEI9_9PEZI|nr:hypothetical protein B0A48_16722 [Cryoendolithus antarcticus]
MPPLAEPDYGLQIKVEQLNVTSAEGCDSCQLLTGLIDQVGWVAADGDVLDCYNDTEDAPLDVSILHAKTRERQTVELYATPSSPSRWECIGLANDVPERLSLEYCSAIVTRWLADCAGHENCPLLERSRYSPPTRLIAIDPMGRSIKLITPDADFVADYVPLSHRWGSQEMIVTTKGNLLQHCDEIPMANLPATFRDAVQLLSAIGIGYAWIDSLCIVQDDKADWAEEAARMSQVYMNGLFTIAADNGPDSSYGLFTAGQNRRVRSGRLSEEINIRPAGERALTAVAHTPIDDRGTKATVSVLSSLAWVFQERLLSNRTLHFTEAEMAWECGTELRCECQVNANPYQQHILPIGLRQVAVRQRSGYPIANGSHRLYPA